MASQAASLSDVCCFSVPAAAGSFLARLFRPRIHVAKTRILARFADATPSGRTRRQLLAYSMNLRVGSDVAMILPLPVEVGAGDGAVEFMDLSGAAQLFDRLDVLFDLDQLAPRKGGFRFAPQRRRLVVHEVGAFVASYVPTEDDFERLDPRFRLPLRLSDAVPAYRDHGFAVFQLKPGDVTVHPMAFTFPSRDPARLFFPTVHVHDGTLKPRARFDHALYWQGSPSGAERSAELAPGDEVSFEPPMSDEKGALALDRHVLRRRLTGDHPNADVWIDVR